ncbi:hypothetical protein [Nocardia sp. NPDC006630]|uniref:hypothetical protein n=1 Tax=Nocardia sp. NPDC006630 TaxID=3157181 RepID=UPI0033B118D5
MSIPDARATVKLRHIRIESGELLLDYNAPAEQAVSIANEIGRLTSDIIVTVDDNVDEEFPFLPCARLWT